MSAEFHRELESIAARALEALTRPGSGRSGRTAWELKMELKVPHTRLYAALGLLVARGAVNLEPGEQTVLVTPAGATSPKAPSEITA